jgi:hypothetical protein
LSWKVLVLKNTPVSLFPDHPPDHKGDAKFLLFFFFCSWDNDSWDAGLGTLINRQFIIAWEINFPAT